MIENKFQNEDQNIFDKNAKVLSNFFCCLTMLEKTLERLARERWYDESQYSDIYFEILSVINSLQKWGKDYKVFSGFHIFQESLCFFIIKITDQVLILIETSKYSPGKKKVSKKFQQKQQAKIQRSINKMLNHLLVYSGQFEDFNTPISESIKKALAESFAETCSKNHEQHRNKRVLSQRGSKTIIFPWDVSKTYLEMVCNKNRFRSEVVEELKNYQHNIGHKLDCKCRGGYKMKGFRKNPRKTIVPGGHQEEFPIRMVECCDCGQRFSLLPSFIPREKHFSIDIIGNILRQIVLFGQSLNGAFETSEMCGRKLKSRQTLLNWLQWMGNFNPAALLIKSGAKCQGYFQEDEGFEKEPGLRTYTVVMADPKTQLIWHIDYVDHVDEKHLYASFEDFLKCINFSVKGITKDKWKASTNALKSVFYKVWIGFCHLHFLKKLNKALSSYQKETKCPWKNVKDFYNKIKKIMGTATHAGALKVKLKVLNEEIIKHPLVKNRIDDLIDNAVHYTSHKQRHGITTTTSIVDNFLKIVKRKLKQVESFRDRISTKFMFKAMANIRNFVPFLPGAKNASKSPFMLADGETYGLPWIQVINMHNGFLFTSE